MYKPKCPHCGIKLRNFLYADTCPCCHEELEYNTGTLMTVLKPESQKTKSWPARLFSRLMHLTER
jgi:hypothetical protein